MTAVKSLTDRLKDGDQIIVAEGYLLEIADRGYLKHGPWVPEVVLDHPNVLRYLHHEFVHAGSDVVVAFTYDGNREKLRQIGRIDELEELNRTALKIAREVADETGTLMAGSITKSTVFQPGDPMSEKEVYTMFEEQVKWAVEGKADFIICETFIYLQEAELALKAAQDFAKGLPVVVTLSPLGDETGDKVPFGEACRQLELAGAAVVGINCYRGPSTLLPLLKDIRQACKGPIAALPNCYRTNTKNPVWFSFRDMDNPDEPSYPNGLHPWLCTQKQIAEFTRQAKALGVQYFGLCCGNRASYTRTLAETLGRKPPASRYSPNHADQFERMKDKRHESMHGIYKDFLKS